MAVTCAAMAIPRNLPTAPKPTMRSPPSPSFIPASASDGYSVTGRGGVQRVSARTHSPNRAAMGTKQSSDHHIECPVRLSTRPAGMAKSASTTIRMIMVEGLSGSGAMRYVSSYGGPSLVSFSAFVLHKYRADAPEARKPGFPCQNPGLRSVLARSHAPDHCAPDYGRQDNRVSRK